VPTNGAFGTRNRIINGDMRIDQRNAGASVTPTGEQYTLDRWVARVTAASKYSVQRNAGSVTPPPGFTNYLGVTSQSAYTLTGNENYNIEQIIEGFNVADLNWGTASAVPCTLSFWVRSSLTGTFGGSIATTRTAVWVMPFTYTISSANTWTYVTVPVTAPTTTGGAETDNTAGVFLRFGLGSIGTAAGGSNGVWTNAGNFVQPSGTVSVVGTNGATFLLTGVQLEPGTVATPFERRSYGQELALCQRYYEKSYAASVAPGTVTTNNGWGIYINAGTLGGRSCEWKVPKRTAPSVTVYSTVTGASGKLNNAGISDVNAVASDPSEHSVLVYAATGTSANFYWHTVASAEL
jgi:hypothetical protein